MSASTTVESIRIARARNLVCSADLAITTLTTCSTVSAPSRITSLRSVDSSGIPSPSPIRQKRRKCTESHTSRTSRPYPQPLRTFSTINRTSVSIAIVGRPSVNRKVPCLTSSERHSSTTGAYTPGSCSSRSIAARSAGSSPTCTPSVVSSSHSPACRDADTFNM